MKLYYFETPNPRKPCAVAKHLGSDVEFVRVDLSQGENKTPEFLAINPNGKVPALTDGDVKLWEAHTIMIYLAHKAGSDLWPSDPLKQIDVLRWLNWDTAHFSRHGGQLYFQHFIKELFGMGPPDDAIVEESSGFFKQFSAVLDKLPGRSRLHCRGFAFGRGLRNRDDSARRGQSQTAARRFRQYCPLAQQHDGAPGLEGALAHRAVGSRLAYPDSLVTATL